MNYSKQLGNYYVCRKMIACAKHALGRQTDRQTDRQPANQTVRQPATCRLL